MRRFIYGEMNWIFGREQGVELMAMMLLCNHTQNLGFQQAIEEE